jgi:polysaccharide biosynthesis protein PslG
VFRRIGGLGALLVCVALLCASAASAQKHMLVGLLDESNTLYGNPDKSFPILKRLRVQVLRVDLYWGGKSGNPRKFGVARSRPEDPTDPSDPAYDWSLYDRTVNYAAQYGVKMLFTVYGTPPWANGNKAPNTAPTNLKALQDFAYAAATRYAGDFPAEDGRPLPAVRYWTAWNEPNQPFQLSPQFKKVGGKYRMQAPIDYAKICNAIYTGVHSTLLANEKVACGVTAPGGNNCARCKRGTISPIAFLRAAKKAGMRRFDAYAHHPYPRLPSEKPTTKPPKNAVTLANIGDLTKEVRRLYGSKPLWVTEYAYQTNPPDRTFGVSWAKQAAYLKQAYAIGRKNPSIQMMLWFLLRDETFLGGWQSGLMTSAGRQKPAFNAFRLLPH